MSIYNQISANKSRTYVIIFLFIILLSGLFLLIGKYFESPSFFFIIGFLFSLLSALGSYYYADKIVLYTVGAKPASKQEFFDYYTVTENLAIASGIPMPKIYIINDPAPNAFATGRDPQHAVIAATTGLLTKLDRSETEGVIAHELSHIKNYDILLSTLVAVLVGTVGLVSDLVLRNMRWTGRSRRSARNPLFLILFILAILLAPLAATLIQLALSRRREFLADASGALLTRYPEGLAKALEKIAQDQNILQSATVNTAHLFITNPLKKGSATTLVASLFSTHPRIEERIKILRNM